MRRNNAYNIALLMALAWGVSWAVPTGAAAKSAAVALPERNPGRSPSIPAPSQTIDAAAAPALRGPVGEAAGAAPNQTTATKVSKQTAGQASSPTAEKPATEADEKAPVGDKPAADSEKPKNEPKKMVAAPASFMPDKVPEPDIHPRRGTSSVPVPS